MKKLLFSLFSLLTITVSATQAAEVMQRQIASLGYATSNRGNVEFFAYCDVVFTAPGGVPVRIQYSTGVHARLAESLEEITTNVISGPEIQPNADYTVIDYIWQWDFSKEWGMSGTGSSSAQTKYTDFTYDPTLPDEEPLPFLL